MHSRKRPAKPQPAGVSRREFIAAATAAAFTIVPRRVLGGPGHVPPSERIHIGAIGVGGQGVSDLQEFLKDPNAQVVAVCDVRRTCDYSQFYYGGVKGWEPAQRLVDETYAAQHGASNYDECSSYVDFEELLDRPDLDAVSIATPDHLHAVPALAAIRKGKHVYCQKPLTYTVRESRALADAAKQHGVVTQMGNQGHATDRLKRLVEMLTSGTIGQFGKSTVGRARVTAGRPDLKKLHLSPKDLTGTSGSARRPIDHIIRLTHRLPGATGERLAPAASATWAVTLSIQRCGPLVSRNR